MKTFSSKFSRLSRNDAIRLDFGMRYVDDVIDFNPLNIKNNYIVLSNVMTELKGKKEKKGDLSEPKRLLELENVYKKFNVLENVEYVDSINSDKTIIKEGDIVISKMTPKLGTMFLNPNHVDYLGSTELVEYSIKDYDPLTIFYILSSNKYLEALGYLESGKNQRRVEGTDLLKLKIPKERNEIKEFIWLSNTELQKKIGERSNMQHIIDNAFENALQINTIPGEKHFGVRLSNVGMDNLLRFSFHNQNYFHTFEHSKIENNLWVPIEEKFLVKGGKRIPKGDSFSKNPTDFYYLRPKEVSLMGVDKDNIPFISDKLHALLRRYAIDSHEFCISNVGTLGKVALINLDELGIGVGNLILSENFVKLSPKEAINEKFYYYYFNSYIFQKQIDREYTITSIKKLGLDKIKKISIPNFGEQLEETIVNGIDSDINKQRAILREIDDLREKIDNHLALLVKPEL